MLRNLSICFHALDDEQLAPPIKIVQLGLQLCQIFHHLL
jgi:hypothetical protein